MAPSLDTAQKLAGHGRGDFARVLTGDRVGRLGSDRSDMGLKIFRFVILSQHIADEIDDLRFCRVGK